MSKPTDEEQMAVWFKTERLRAAHEGEFPHLYMDIKRTLEKLETVELAPPQRRWFLRLRNAYLKRDKGLTDQQRFVLGNIASKVGAIVKKENA